MIYMPALSYLGNVLHVCEYLNPRRNTGNRSKSNSSPTMDYRWNVLTAIFFTQVLMVIGYCAALATFPDYWWTCTLCFGLPFSYIAIQNIYIDHDVMHGATFPVYEWQRFLTHPFADFFSLPWEEFVLEHNRHHASTVDLLIQGEFGWDPEEFHYALQQWAGPWSSNWYKYLLTVPFIPVTRCPSSTLLPFLVWGPLIKTEY